MVRPARPTLLGRQNQPRVTAQILDNRAVSEIEVDPQGNMRPMCRKADGTTYPAKMFDAIPLVEALARDYPAAHEASATRADGTPLDQSYYLTSYNVLDVGGMPLESGQEFKFEYFGHRCPRLAKVSPRLLESAGVIADRRHVVASIAMIDGDLADLWPKSDPAHAHRYANPDPKVVEKLAWNDELFDLFRDDVLPRLRESMPIIDKVACWYTTANGWRAVWCFNRPVPVFGEHGCLEDILQGLMIELGKAGVGVDTGCKDWTRNMRVPRCYKGRNRTSDNPFFRLSWNCIDPTANECEDLPETLNAWSPDIFPRKSETRIEDLIAHENWSVISKGVYGSGKSSSSGKEFDWDSVADGGANLGACPTDDEVANLLYINQSLNQHTNEWGIIKKEINKQASRKKSPARASIARALYSLIYEPNGDIEHFSKIHGRSGLHYGNFFATWNICNLLKDSLPSPQMIYALMLDPYLRAMQKRAETGGEARTEEAVKSEAWRAVVANYPMVKATLDQEQTEREEEEQQALLYEVTKQGQNKIDIDNIKLQLRMWTGLAEEYIEENWQHMLMIRSNLGTQILVIKDGKIEYTQPYQSVAGYVSAMRDAGHLLFNTHTAGDTPKVRDDKDFMYDYGIDVGDRVRLSRIEGSSRIDAVRMNGADYIRAIIKLPGVAGDVKPLYHEKIDNYIRLVAGNNYDKLCDWLACFTDIKNPLPALYIHGDPGIGKGMILAGLKKLTALNYGAAFSGAMGEFQDLYKDTFLIIADEDDGTSKMTKKDVVSVIRRMIGGENGQLNFKNVKGCVVEGEWRLVISANNADFLNIQHDQTGSDIQALQGRIFYLHCDQPSKVCDYLYRSGGRYGNSLGVGTKDWPQMIAEHVMYLADNRKVQKGVRFLMDPPETEWHKNLRVASNNGETVCKAIYRALQAYIHMPQERSAVYLDTVRGKIYANSSDLESFMEREFPKFAGNIAKTLALLSVEPKSKPVSINIPNQPRKADKRRVYELDIGAMMNAWNKLGYDIDLREAFGPDMWGTAVPDQLRFDIMNQDTQEPASTVSRPPPRKAS